MIITSSCTHCLKTQEINLEFPTQLPLPVCPCQKDLFRHPTEAFLEFGKLDQCPCCGAAHLYKIRDFNRRLGIALIVLGVLGSYWTYGLTLVFVTLLDFGLSKFVGKVGLCYKCQTQFRKDQSIATLADFSLNLHDYYQNTKEV